MRVLIIFTASLLVTPTLQDQAKIHFHRLDTDSNGLLVREEVPDHLLDRYDDLLARTGRAQDDGLRISEFRYVVTLPATLPDFVWTAAGEFALGLVLGLGVFTILSGVQLAGEMIDQQTGIALGEVANPSLDVSGSVTGQFLSMLCIAALLVMEPLGYHLEMMGALVETFQALPVGDAFVNSSAIDLLGDLVHESLVLGVQIAAPLLATMSLVALTLGFLGHTVPQINVLVIGFPVRAIINIIILAVTLSGTARTVVDLVPNVIDRLRDSLMML